jgi:hypothetical protein
MEVAESKSYEPDLPYDTNTTRASSQALAKVVISKQRNIRRRLEE